MRKEKNYHYHPARAMLRRDLGLFLREVPAALLIAAVLGAFCVLAASALLHGTDSGYTLAPVAVVDEDSSFTSSIAISMIAKQDFASPVEVVKTSARNAEQGLADGTFSAALYLPKGYTGDILTGRRSSARLVLSENAPLHADVVKLLCSFGEDLLSTGQFGVFAGERLVLQSAPERHSAYLQKSNARFLTQALSDPQIAREQIPYALTGVSPESWYVLIYTMTFFQLMILGCFFVSRDCSTAMLRRLRAAELEDRTFLGVKLGIVYALFLLLAASAAAAAGIRFTLSNLGTGMAALLTFAAVGMAMLLCLPQELAVTAVTVLAAVGLFASGGIVPRMELPRWVLTFGDLLPIGASARLTAVLFGGNPDLRFLPVCGLWIAAAWIAMRHHLKRVRKGAAV